MKCKMCSFNRAVRILRTYNVCGICRKILLEDNKLRHRMRKDIPKNFDLLKQITDSKNYEDYLKHFSEDRRKRWSKK